MEMAEERYGPVVVLVPSADLDAGMLPSFTTRLEALVEAGVRGVLWDLQRVEFLPSGGVGCLVHAARRLAAAGGHMALARVGRRVRATLAIMGVADVFPIVETAEEGVRVLRERLRASA